MRRMFTSEEAARPGVTKAALQWGESKGKWRRLARGVYGEGAQPPTPLETAVAGLLRKRATARGEVAAALHGLDSIELDLASRRRTPCPGRTVMVDGVPTANGLQTLLDLSLTQSDERWECALESALRKRLVTEAELWAELDGPARPGHGRIRRVLERRGRGVPPTESLLETLMVQLARGVDGLAAPVRQHKVFDANLAFVARVDLCWPLLGLFVELDGQHHRDQPVYDSRRETAVVAATGWLCGRFTWTEVARLPTTTTRRLSALTAQASARPVAS